MTGDRKTGARARVMFVCIGNSCRSPMAEAIAKRLGADVMEASSAGLAALGQVQSMTKETLLRNGYSGDDLASKQIQWEALRRVDLVINMSGRPNAVAPAGAAKVEDWEVEDPYGEDAASYQRIFEDIERRVAELVKRLTKECNAGIRGPRGNVGRVE
ncbi:MAG TPA: low molecular weight phosphatase family protein [Candidatus Methylomirabilis sp.]|nr:low molecular weight phosphatase family protein [Candidatus Methylomirabilis sp.]